MVFHPLEGTSKNVEVPAARQRAARDQARKRSIGGDESGPAPDSSTRKTVGTMVFRGSLEGAGGFKQLASKALPFKGRLWVGMGLPCWCCSYWTVIAVERAARAFDDRLVDRKGALAHAAALNICS
jgi:hypothetical protein